MSESTLLNNQDENRDQLVDDSIEVCTEALKAHLAALGLPVVAMNIALNDLSFIVELSPSPYDAPDVWQQYATALALDVGPDDLQREVNKELARLMDNLFDWSLVK